MSILPGRLLPGQCSASRRAGHCVLYPFLTALLVAGCVSERDGPTARAQRAADDPGALLRIAKAAEQGGDLSGAADFYDRAFTLRPEAGAAVGLARTRAGLGQPDEALAALRTAHAGSPSDHRLTAMLGRLEIYSRQPARALAVFQDGLRQAPADPELLTGQGVALDGLGRHGEAQVSYRQVLARDPASIAARNNLALSLALSGQATEAAGLLRGLAADVTARGSSAQVATVQGNLALVHGLSGNESRARQVLGASLPAADLADNLRVYSLLRDGFAAGDQSGPAGPAPAAVGATGPAAEGVPPTMPGEKADTPS